MGRWRSHHARSVWEHQNHRWSLAISPRTGESVEPYAYSVTVSRGGTLGTDAMRDAGQPLRSLDPASSPIAGGKRVPSDGRRPLGGRVRQAIHTSRRWLLRIAEQSKIENTILEIFLAAEKTRTDGKKYLEIRSIAPDVRIKKGQLPPCQVPGDADGIAELCPVQKYYVTILDFHWGSVYLSGDFFVSVSGIPCFPQIGGNGPTLKIENFAQIFLPVFLHEKDANRALRVLSFHCP